MRFIESTDLLKIEDILPFFPDFVVIDDFKTEICNALEDYSARIDELRAEMDEATASAESIKRDIEGLANRFVTVEQGDRCWKCGLPLMTRQFYVFPCQHTFHADCLISMVRAVVPVTGCLMSDWNIGHGVSTRGVAPENTPLAGRACSTRKGLGSGSAFFQLPLVWHRHASQRQEGQAGTRHVWQCRDRPSPRRDGSK
jgi:hypothetical protein